FRCLDCIPRRLLCATCARDSHTSSPFHRMEEWANTHFQPAPKWQLTAGLELWIGHNGKRC
ncbi:hypothetical protein BXZ70DRAFT_857867, partial [Cristinia sonorae]